MGAPNGAPVAPPSTISSTALTYEESSDARKSTALATSSGSPQRPCGTAEEKNFASLAESSSEAEARGPRSGLVGTPQYVADRIGQFERAGVDLLLQFSPQAEEMDRFSETVIRPATAHAAAH